MSKTRVKKLLNSMDKTDIVFLILDMYDTKKEIKEFLEYYVNPNEKEQFEKCKRIIEKEYSLTALNSKARLSIAKKAISDFSKLSPSLELEAELMIFLVECGCEYTHSFGDMSESFYISMANNFERALKFMHKNNLLEKFRPNVDRCLKWASHCGYGFEDDLNYVLDEYYL